MARFPGRCGWSYGWILCLLGCGGRVGENAGEAEPTAKGGASNTSWSTPLGGSRATGLGGASTVSGGAPTASGGAIQVTLLTLEPCGNNRLEPGEECDDGNHLSGDGCSAVCQIEPGDCPVPGCSALVVCGDGKLASSELCDDGNVLDGDGCSSDCTTWEPGWSCPWPGHACVSNCGDSLVVGAENCDNGSSNGVFVAGIAEGCSHDCRMVPSCMLDGAPNPCPELCGNSDPAGNPAYCPGVCGNGIKDWNEQCDLGVANDEDGYQSCTATCKYGSFCGDGVLDAPEECDLGPQNGAAYGMENGCSSQCELVHYCGDGILDEVFGEECDDGAWNGSRDTLCTKTCSVYIGP